MKVFLAGCGGLIGRRLSALLKNAGHHVVRMVRPGSSRQDEGESITWDPAAGNLDGDLLKGGDAVVFLGGANIAERMWTPSFKEEILTSRTQGALLISETLAAMEDGPSTFLCASAIGYYGDRGDQFLTEDDAAGSGFLSDVVVAWEACTKPAADAGVRVINTRIGIVLSPHGGALKSMLTPFKLYLGGPVGGGRQYMSWIGLDDVVAALIHCLETDGLNGPVNLVAPNPVTNREFTKTLASSLNRPALMPLPGFVVSLALGDMGRSLLLASTRVACSKLQESGFQFQQERLDVLLKGMLSHA